MYNAEQAVISGPGLCLLWNTIHFFGLSLHWNSSAACVALWLQSSQWTKANGPERQGNLARVMEMMRKALEYCQSPIYGVERAREGERSSDRERISEGRRHGSAREWSPAQEGLVLALCSWRGGCTLTRANGGYGFTCIRWRQQGCCQREREKEKEREGKHQCSRMKTFISAGYNNQQNVSLFSPPLEGRICRAL